MSAIVIIPARFSSTRFPGKPLAVVGGKPVIQRVYENSKMSRLASEVVVATDNARILDAVTGFGGLAVMTSMHHLSGTDRIAEVAQMSAYEGYDIIINVQGDEPLIRPEMIDDAIDLLGDPEADISTLAKRITRPEDVFDPNVVKVVFDRRGFALYFSRAPIPFHRESWRRTVAGGYEAAGEIEAFKHVGIYGYRRHALLRMSSLPESAIEAIEKLEQLRALEDGMKIKVKETVFETIGVDTPEDMEKVEKWLSTSL